MHTKKKELLVPDMYSLETTSKKYKIIFVYLKTANIHIYKYQICIR